MDIKNNKFKSWGVRKRVSYKCNYNAMWYNLKTVRFGEGTANELPPELSEFYDIGINTRCNAECPWCYVSASHDGIDYENVCDTWNKWIKRYFETKRGSVTYTNKPFQVALGE